MQLESLSIRASVVPGSRELHRAALGANLKLRH